MPVLEAVEKARSLVAVKNVLFATDFSEASEAALPYAAAFSEYFGSQLHLTHVLPDVKLLRPGAPDPAVFGPIYEDAHGNAHDKMRRLSKRLKSAPHQVYVRHGDIARVVSDMVQELEIDLVIAGTHGRTGLGRLIMGSVAEEILRQAPCPVLTVGPNVVGASVRSLSRFARDAKLSAAEIRDVLYATDFRQQSNEAAVLAASVANAFGAKLGMLNVVEDYGDHLSEDPGPVEASLKKLRELLPTDLDLEHAPELLAQFGVAADSILQTAAERESDLIVLGARPANGHLKAATHLSAAVAHRIIVGANCPVLTVRA
jgi:nucleotide-binding universal stress UspA family protein